MSRGLCDYFVTVGSRLAKGADRPPCIRMSIPDVIELYDRVPVGAPIYIA
jgi:hypothetical protein